MTCKEYTIRLAAAAAVLSVASIGTAAAQGLTFTDEEKTPLACDRKFSVAELAEYAPPKPNESYTIAISVPSFANPYIQALIYGAEVAAEEAGVTLAVGAGRGFMDPASQITQLENALTQRPDAVLINPADPAGLALAIDDAIAAGTPVVEVGTLSASEIATKLVQDDYMIGRSAAQGVGEAFADGGQGIVMGGPANASWSRRRVAGFLDGIVEFPNVQVNAVVNTDIDPQEGLTRFTNTTQAHPQVDWVYSTGSFLLAPQSIPEEFSETRYFAGGLTPVTIDALNAGSADVILPDFPVSVGYIGVGLAIAKLNGEEVPQRNCIPDDTMTVSDLSEPVWIETSVVAEDWEAPQ